MIIFLLCIGLIFLAFLWYFLNKFLVSYLSKKFENFSESEKKLLGGLLVIGIFYPYLLYIETNFF